MNRNDYQSEILDTDSLVETQSFKIGGYTSCNVVVQHETGSHANHEVTVFLKPKNGKWMQSGHKITGRGYLIFDVMFNQMKVKVTTAEGSASESNIIMVGTRV